MNPSEHDVYQRTHLRNPSPPPFTSLQNGNENVTGSAELNDLKNSILVRKEEENHQLRNKVDKANLEKKRVEEENANLLYQLGEKDKALKAAEEKNKLLQSLHETIIGDLKKEHEKKVNIIQTNLIGTELKLEEVKVLSIQKKRELEKQAGALQILLDNTELELQEQKTINSDLNRQLCNQGTDLATPRVQLEEIMVLEDLQAHHAETSSRQCISRNGFGPSCPMKRKVEKNGTQAETGSSSNALKRQKS